MLAARLRTVHLDMVGAVLRGEGLERVAELAAEAAEAPVVISVPRLAVRTGSTARGAPVGEAVLAAAEGSARMTVPIASGDDVVGGVMLLGQDGDPEAREVLQLAAMASLTEIALADARDEAVETVRGGLLDDVRNGRVDEPALLRRAGRLGCDLSSGLVAMCAEVATTRPRHLVATLQEEWPGALVEWRDDGRLVALLPADEERAAGAGALAARLRRSGAVGMSGFHPGAATATRALEEAELVLDVSRRNGGADADRLDHGTYRLLFRVFASRPEEVRAFHSETIAPLVEYDARSGSDLVGTLTAYFEHDCSMASAAAALFVHRHTIAYRLDRVRELTGLDPLVSEHRERLGIGLKAHRIISAGS